MESLAETISQLPPPALVIFSVTVAVLFMSRYLGLIKGEREDKANDPGQARVAAVIVDPTALREATKAVNDLTSAMRDRSAQDKDMAHMLARRFEKIAEKVEGLTDEINDVRIDMAKRG